MGEKRKTNSLATSLGKLSEVTAFLEAGNTKPLQKSAKQVERMAITIRLPLELGHALIDSSAERRKSKERPCSQQDIVAEALEAWFESN